MLKRRSISRAARLLLGVLAFAQAALAWSACGGMERSPQRAFEHEPECHRTADAPNVNLCLMHCTSDKQSLDKPSLHLHAFSDAAILVVRVQPAADARTGPALRNISPFAGAPPPRVLFGVMRT